MSGTAARPLGAVNAPSTAERLARIRARLDQAAAPTEAEIALLLRTRAAELARVAAPAPVGEELTLLVLALGMEQYGIEARFVTGVFRLTDLAPLPGARGAILGVTAWRGALLLLADPRLLLGLPAAGLDDRVWVVAVSDGGRTLGLLAGTVAGITTIQAAALGATPGTSEVRRGLVRGMTPDAVLVLDAAAILHSHRRGA